MPEEIVTDDDRYRVALALVHFAETEIIEECRGDRGALEWWIGQTSLMMIECTRDGATKAAAQCERFRDQLLAVRPIGGEEYRHDG